MTAIVPTEHAVPVSPAAEPGAESPRTPALAHQHTAGCYWDVVTCAWSCKDGCATSS